VIPNAVSKLGVKPGDPVKPGSSTDKAMKTDQRVVVMVPSSLYGQPYIATAIPIKNSSGAVIGSMVTISLAVKQEKFSKMSSELNEAVGIISGNTANIVAASQQLAAEAGQLARNSGVICQEAKNMDGVLELIEEITRQTHLLGLNAAIEAARAGDMGKGFNVVAEEIRKLASRTSGSLNEIKLKLSSIQEKTSLLEKNSEEILAVSEEQVSSIEEIDSSLRSIQETTGMLNEEAKDYELS
jgi:Methyl-accepting chemotaxis protein